MSLLIGLITPHHTSTTQLKLQLKAELSVNLATESTVNTLSTLLLNPICNIL